MLSLVAGRQQPPHSNPTRPLLPPIKTRNRDRQSASMYTTCARTEHHTLESTPASSPKSAYLPRAHNMLAMQHTWEKLQQPRQNFS